MTSVPLPAVEDALSRAKAAIEKQERCIALFGPPGSGRTTALDRLAAEHHDAIRLQLPRDDDGAIAALASLAAQLPEPTACAAVFKDIKRTFSERLEALASRIPAQASLFFSEPALRPAAPAGEETRFSLCAQELSARVLRQPTRLKVFTVSGADPQLAMLGAYSVEVKREADPAVILSRAQLPQQLLAAYAGRLAHRSPIEIRLAAWLAGRVDGEPLRLTDFRLEELIRLAATKISNGVRLMLARLSLVREHSVSAWLDWAARGVSAADRAVVETVFLFGDDGHRLHGSIAKLAHDWLPNRVAAHRELAAEYKQRFITAASATSLGDALRAEVEVIHHRTEAGDATLLHDTVFFAEQYDRLGRVFGKAGERDLLRGKGTTGRKSIRAAIACYQRALEHDPADWYAAHYLAFNHDVLGDDVVATEQHYRRALELRPAFVWTHSRWVRFLITCGRYDEAKSALGAALDACPASGPRYYEELHLDAAKQYLHFGAWPEALEVLERVPEASRPSDYERLVRYARWQSEPDRDELVFPPSRSMSARERPAFLQAGEKLVRFMPGRLASRQGNVWRFRVKLPTGGFGWRAAKTAELKKLGLGEWLEVGAFVEFRTVRQGGKQLERAALHASVEDPFSDLDVRYPPPDRYLDA